MKVQFSRYVSGNHRILEMCISAQGGYHVRTIAKNASGAQETGCDQGQDRLDEIVTIVNQRRNLLYGVALRYLRNAAEAEDAVQDALLLAIKRVNQFKGDAQLSTWLTKILINVSLMKIRRRTVEQQVSVDALNWNEDNQLAPQVFVDDRPDPEEVYRQQECSEKLQQMVLRLSPMLRQTHELRNVHELTIRETASILGVSEVAVKARSLRTREKLRELMAKRV